MSKPRILVVDNDRILSDLVRVFLEKTTRFEVRVENRLAQAVTTAQEFRPHLILLDVDMLGDEERVIAHELSRQPSWDGVPIVFCTSLISPAETRNRMAVRGGMRYLAKPLDPVVLVDTIARVLTEEERITNL